ncbi:MAG: hypothetical protein KDG52_18325 [Rhodocyclaceae bacterium]|nr:hypothetical protein [Rhodocyclaceae bacterium]
MLVTHLSEAAERGGSHGGAAPRIGPAGRERGLIAELQHLAALSDDGICLETRLRALSRITARLLAVERCAIALTTADADMPRSDDDAIALGRELGAAIRFGGQRVGEVRVSGACGRARFDDADRVLLELVTVCIGQSLETLQLQRILQSRLALASLAHDAAGLRSTEAPGVPDFARMIRILARSFYRELRKAGFGATEVIGATSQIIAELSTDLRRDGQPRAGDE